MKKLVCFGIINCVGLPVHKVDILYNLVQEGGKDVHRFIGASDKDFQRHFETMCRFVTTDLFTIAKDIDKIECNLQASQINEISRVLSARDGAGVGI